nr:hypothetical protein [Tanacetum cinerariifolium]
MGDRRSKEDDVNKISSSIFVTNFPDNFSAKELWKACNQYVSVVDAFIPNRRSIAGKSNTYNKGAQNGSRVVLKESRMYGSSKSYAHAVKIRPQIVNEKEDSPAIVLDDTCINKKLMGKVKEFSSLTNLKVVLDERVTWLDIEGIPLKVWSKNTFSRITAKWGALVYFEDQEEGYLHSRRVCIKTKFVENIFESFKIIIQGKTYWIRAKEVTGWIPDFLEDDEKGSRSDDEGSFDSNSDDNCEMNKGSNLEGDTDIEEFAGTILRRNNPLVT